MTLLKLYEIEQIWEDMEMHNVAFFMKDDIHYYIDNGYVFTDTGMHSRKLVAICYDIYQFIEFMES